MPRRRRPPAQALPEHLERHDTWNGLRAGDPVDIEGPPTRGAVWRFRAFVRNTRNGAESVEVVGGGPGEHHVRSFLPGQVFPAGGRRRGEPSLADAPRLPFD
ncbi:MAG TPA: hypothetical protein VE991_05595 [Acidimicrobiales bacterium]|nr:hypothetical protein [Acidimicrobiales bacterium]